MISESKQPVKDTLRALMAQAQRNGPVSQAQADVTAYDFFVPHHFTPDQRQCLQDAAEAIAKQLTKVLSETLKGSFPITPAALSESYADRLETADRDYYVALQSDGETVGFLQLPSDTSVGCVTQLLGGLADGDAKEERVLSALELDILLDVANKIAGAFSDLCATAGGPVTQCASKISCDPIDLARAKEAIDVCRFDFERSGDKKTLPFSIVILSSLLEPMAGQIHPPKQSEDQVRQNVFSHIEHVGMPIQIRLDTVDILLRDIATLEPGDVIMLQTSTRELIDVVTSNKTIMTGRPVQHNGWCGVQIVSTEEKSQKT